MPELMGVRPTGTECTVIYYQETDIQCDQQARTVLVSECNYLSP